MTDIFDAKILCKNCGVVMKPTIVNKGGFELRAVQCEKCGDKIIHPADLNASDHYKDLKGKTYNVKLRVVGNSHAISIPKEIVEFMEEMNKMRSNIRSEMDNMVKLCFEDFGKLRVDFFDNDMDNEEYEDLNHANHDEMDRFKIKKLRRDQNGKR